MANTFTKIFTSIVGSGGASTIEFTAIPSTYTDLCLKLSLRDTRSGVGSNAAIGFNTSTSNFTFIRLIGDGATAESDTTFGLGVVNGNTSTGSVFSSVEVYIPNYAGSNNKTYSADAVSENGATAAYQQLTAGLWSQTAAITGITIYPTAGQTWMQYSTATLYGIKSS
jgi:hypothetical protein